MSGDLKPRKRRVDQLLLERELADSLEHARHLILAGKVRVGADHVIRNGSETVADNADIQVAGDRQYVSRGAYKLQAALESFLPDLTGMTAMDVGASTGGFTDLMLQSGAGKVYAVDSGRGQLHAKLRNDVRVECREQTNARTLPDTFLTEPVDLLTMDVSFISVKALLPSVNRFLRRGGHAFILVKPQFEALRREVGRGGVVRDPSVCRRCVEEVTAFCAVELGWELLDAAPCLITGPKGNQEYMCVFLKP